MSTTGKSSARAVPFSALSFTPRAEGGEQAQLATICGTEDGSKLGCGLARLKNARLEWTVKYDEVLFVLEGSIKVHTPDGVLNAGRHDAVWLPSDTPLIYEAEDALVLFAIHPADWNDK